MGFEDDDGNDDLGMVTILVLPGGRGHRIAGAEFCIALRYGYFMR